MWTFAKGLWTFAHSAFTSTYYAKGVKSPIAFPRKSPQRRFGEDAKLSEIRHIRKESYMRMSSANRRIMHANSLAAQRST
jgi:hypothetical protein